MQQKERNTGLVIKTISRTSSPRTCSYESFLLSSTNTPASFGSSYLLNKTMRLRIEEGKM